MIEEPLPDSGESRSGLQPAIEAILLVADEPVPENTLAQVLEVAQQDVAAALHGLADTYAEQAEYAPVVERFVSDGQEVRLTQAALETLAVVAYRQPVSRGQVSAVRGVNCDGVMRTLSLRGLVTEAGTDAETGATLFRTTAYFLERLGIASLDKLPELAPFLPDHLDDEQDQSHDRPS